MVVAIEIHLMFKSVFIVGRNRFHKVMKELRRFCKTSLYKLKNVKINEDWKQVFDQKKDAYTCETDTKSNDDNDDYEEESVTKIILHGFSDSYGIYDIHNNQIKVSPTEGHRPLGIFKDRYLEEMNFLTMFYGKK